MLPSEQEFQDIRPYNDDELTPVLRRLSRNDWLITGIRGVMFPGCPDFMTSLANKFVKFNLWSRLRRVKTIDEFQRKIIIDRVVAYIIKKSIESVSSSGTEYLSVNSPYIFISNHRDIILDSALINYIMVRKELNIAEIAFGDNLLLNDFVSDLIRINRSFIVRRDLPLRQRARAAVTLSRYIMHTTGLGNSVWVSQREGRAKDGDDRTNPSVIKMLYIAPKREKMSFQDFLYSVNIVPVSISYEFDPCDLLKARELHRTDQSGEYRKRKDEDLLSMYAGLKGSKGRVHLSFGSAVRGDFQSPEEVATEIDRTIHREYKLWPSNYIAYDTLHGKDDHSSSYSRKDVEDFLHRFRRESSPVRSIALKIYANAVINHMKQLEA